MVELPVEIGGVTFFSGTGCNACPEEFDCVVELPGNEPIPMCEDCFERECDIHSDEAGVVWIQ